jgi:hypothetical protein
MFLWAGLFRTSNSLLAYWNTTGPLIQPNLKTANAVVVRGNYDHCFVPPIIRIARQKGVSAYAGDGLDLWPAVHRLDAARFFTVVIDSLLGESGWWYAPLGRAFEAVCEFD